ncbi:MAG: sulfatase-like hydrolase/transferase [Luteitalea sp.]|nr:sulfatase-like hydrolase/transferase [Luteitalea sp.]
MRTRGILTIALLLGAHWSAPGPRAAPSERPNIVFFLVDDLGYMDIGANNPQTFYETPHVDRLASEGLRFTTGYAVNPVCSPTRYSLMTGKYPTRVAATNFFTGTREGWFKPAPLSDRMPLGEITLAEALRAVGYRTAFLGKWHLGPTEEYWPENQGFEINIGGHSAGAPSKGYFAPWNNPRLEDGPPNEHLTARLAEEAVGLLEELRDDPFLLYLSFYTVHTPLQAPEALVAKYRRKAAALPPVEEFADEEQVWPVDEPRRVRVAQRHAVYAAMVETMDTAVGRVLAKLDELGLAENTVVVFLSDNGGLSTSEGAPTSNLPLRGGKGWLYEGGIREPWLVTWPGVTKPGSTSDVPVSTVDVYPTLLEIAGATEHGGTVVDGESLVPLLRHRAIDGSASAGALANRPLYWHYPHYGNQGGFPGGAVRVGDWKLIERYEDGRAHLYNLADDIGERHDLAPKEPERVEELRDQLHAWYREVNAMFLQPRQPWRPPAYEE